MDDNVEVEVKFYVPDLAAVRERLLAAGGRIKKERIYERNVRFDDEAESLRYSLRLLRLRQDTAAKITFKGPAPAGYADSEAKVREELEVEVSDFDTAAAIFEKLGFRPLQVYEKYRETIQVGAVEAVLDEMPFGNILELEGSEANIKKLAAELGLDWEQRILLNYLAMMGQLKTHHNLPFDDLTFDNFADLNVSIADILE